MERSSSEEWIKNLKIALVENNHKKIYQLIVNLPEFDNFEQAKEASTMIETALDIFQKEKNDARKNMNNMKKMKEFLVNNKKSKFDKHS